MGWSGLEWAAVGWSGLEWVGVGWSGLELAAYNMSALHFKHVKEDTHDAHLEVTHTVTLFVLNNEVDFPKSHGHACHLYTFSVASLSMRHFMYMRRPMVVPTSMMQERSMRSFLMILHVPVASGACSNASMMQERST